MQNHTFISTTVLYHEFLPNIFTKPALKNQISHTCVNKNYYPLRNPTSKINKTGFVNLQSPQLFPFFYLFIFNLSFPICIKKENIPYVPAPILLIRERGGYLGLVLPPPFLGFYFAVLAQQMALFKQICFGILFLLCILWKPCVEYWISICDPNIKEDRWAKGGLHVDKIRKKRNKNLKRAH